MRRLAFYAVLALTLSSSATLAQSIQNFTPCQFEKSTSIGVSNGIETRRVTILYNHKSYGASVFLPASNAPTPGILFSHSAIKGTEGSADLLRFAYALARAGAASIVLDGTMSWGEPGLDFRRSPHLEACAGQWLLTHASLDTRRLAVAGNLGQWGSGTTPACLPGEDPCWVGHVYINFGESLNYETGNTKGMLTLEGQSHLADFASRHLGLAKVQPQWLDQAVQRQ